MCLCVCGCIWQGWRKSLNRVKCQKMVYQSVPHTLTHTHKYTIIINWTLLSMNNHPRKDDVYISTGKFPSYLKFYTTNMPPSGWLGSEKKRNREQAERNEKWTNWKATCSQEVLKLLRFQHQEPMNLCTHTLPPLPPLSTFWSNKAQSIVDVFHRNRQTLTNARTLSIYSYFNAIELLLLLPRATWNAMKFDWKFY